jgi:hypothetical protein
MSTVNINLNNVQETLVSGTNIKTVNGNSLLGSGDVAITIDKTENVVKQVRNVSGGTLAIGTAVRITGATGQNPNVVVANATSGGVPDRGTEKNIIFGITTQSINNNAVGEILIKGTLKNFNTTAFDVGDFIFLPATGTTYTTTPPTAPAYQICLGLVIKKAADGEVCVNVQEPVHINDVTGLVMNRATLADRQAMIYNGSIFVNRLLEAADIATGTLAAARLPLPTTTDIGAVKRNTGSAGQFVTGIDASGNLEYSTPTGGGDVTGAASSVNNNIAVFDGTTGKVIKDGGETIASINSTIAGKENTITAGTTGQYFRGDKTFQNLDKTAVGLGNVDNTSDANKPISSATQTALDAKEPTITAGTSGQYYRGDKTFQTLDKTAVGLSNVANVDQQNADNITSGTLGGARLPNPTTTVLGGVKRNTGSAGQFVSGIDASGNLEYSTPTGGGDVTGAASSVNNNIAVFDGTTGKIIKDGGETIASINSSIAAKENAITAGTTGQYFRGDKTFQTLDKTAVGLGNVDNTSDTNKPISTATQTALDDKVDKVTGKGLSQEDYTTTEKNKLAGIETGAQVNTVTSVATKTGAVTLDKNDVGLGNVANVDQQNADNITSGTLGGARLPVPTTTVLGGVKRNTGSAGQFVTGIDVAGELEYGTPSGGGDVTGAASSVNNNIAVFDGTTGKIIKDGGETIASINSSIGGKEPTITAGTTGQYFRGDKTFQTLDNAAVGLGNVANVDQQNADNITSGTLGGARLPAPTTTVLGGVKRNTGSAGQVVSGIDASGNLEYTTPSGAGDVVGPSSVVDERIAVFDGTTGKLIKDGGVTISEIGGSIDELQVVLLTQVFS